jgi:hypothetical protein
MTDDPATQGALRDQQGALRDGEAVEGRHERAQPQHGYDPTWINGTQPSARRDDPYAGVPPANIEPRGICEAVDLLKRLLARKLSRCEPDPLHALENAGG